MYVRSYMIRGVRYIHVVYTYRWRSKVKRVTVSVLGQYDKDRLKEFRMLVSDWQSLRRAQVVIDDLNDLAISTRGRESLARYSLRRGRLKGILRRQKPWDEPRNTGNA